MNRSRCRSSYTIGFALCALLTASCGGRDANHTLNPTLSELASEEKAEILIVAFGNSLTAGKDLADPERQAFPALLELRLRAEGHPVRIINSGYSGNTTFDALHRLDYSIPENADIVIVEFGENDTFQGKKLADIESNLSEIIRRTNAKGAKVLLCELHTFPNYGIVYSKGFSEIFPRLADKYDLILVPWFLDGVANNPKYNMPDGIHPNARGHERIAENVYPTLLEAIKNL